MNSTLGGSLLISLEGHAATPDPALLKLLPADRLERLRRYVQTADRLRCYAAGLGAMYLAARLADCSLRQVQLHTPQWQPPYALCRGKRLCMSISHAGDYVLCMGDSAPCGCDVEQIRDVPEYMELAQRYYSPAEYEALLRIPEGSARRKDPVNLYYSLTLNIEP